MCNKILKYNLNSRLFKDRNETSSANRKFLLKSSDNFIGLGPTQDGEIIGSTQTNRKQQTNLPH